MSSLYEKKTIIARYKGIAYIMVLLGICVVAKATYTATVQRDYWAKVASRLTRDSVEVKPVRGNILSCDGQLLAGTLPQYQIFMDFKAGGERKDSIWMEKLDSICMGLHNIFPSQSAEEFKKHLEEGRELGSQHWKIWPRRISYDVFQEVKKLPVFNMSANKGGFHFESNTARQRPFGQLALRTIGDMFAAKDSARFGLEQSYDTVLRGKTGIVQRKKVMNRYHGYRMSLPPAS